MAHRVVHAGEALHGVPGGCVGFFTAIGGATPGMPVTAFRRLNAPNRPNKPTQSPFKSEVAPMELCAVLLSRAGRTQCRDRSPVYSPVRCMRPRRSTDRDRCELAWVYRRSQSRTRRLRQEFDTT